MKLSLDAADRAFHIRRGWPRTRTGSACFAHRGRSKPARQGRRRGSARELPFVTRPPKPNANGHRHPPPATPLAALTEIGQQMAHSHRRAAAPPTTQKAALAPRATSAIRNQESDSRFGRTADGGLEPGGLKAGGRSPSSPSPESRRVRYFRRPDRRPAAANAGGGGGVAQRREESDHDHARRLPPTRLAASRACSIYSIDILRVAAVDAVRWRITAGRGVGPCSTGCVRSAETGCGRRQTADGQTGVGRAGSHRY